MIVKIFEPVAVFGVVRYNTDKMDKGKGELLKVSGFGPLMGFNNRRPEDYRAYLELVSGLNKRIRKPVFHATISAAGKTHNKEQLLDIADKWLKAMGYGEQPYLVVFHKDTNNNHVHLVSTRIDKQGKRINSSFEHVRGIRELNKIMGIKEEQESNKDIAKALTYRFATKAQFAMILEEWGYKVVEKDTDLEVIKYGKVQGKVALKSLERKMGDYQPDKHRALGLKAIFVNYLQYDKAEALAEFLKNKMGIIIIFHAAAGKPRYGYSVIDHAQQRVFKGSEILPLKELLESQPVKEPWQSKDDGLPEQQMDSKIMGNMPSEENTKEKVEFGDEPISISIAQDVDDEAVHGRLRRKRRHLTR